MHHPYVTDLVYAMLLVGDRADHLPRKDLEELMEVPGTMASLQEVTLHIDCLFELYVAERQLL